MKIERLLIYSILSFFTITIVSAQGTGSDTPCGAVNIAVPTSCILNQPISYTFTTMGSASVTTSPPAPTAAGGCPAGVGGNHEDRWFKFTMPPNQTVAHLTMSWSGCFFCSDNPGFALYSSPTNNCSNLVLEDCDGDNSAFPVSDLDLVYYGLTPGNTYWCRVWETDNDGSDIDITIHYDPNNDVCANALPLAGAATNYCATALGEPNTWTPTPNGTCGGAWSSNENGVWYSFAVTSSTPQPISISVSNIACLGGTTTDYLQMGIWSNNCNLGNAQFYTCRAGSGNQTLGPITLPVGDYYLYCDGNAGANCTWQFSSPQLLVDLTNNGPKCANDPITLTATINQGTAPYTYRFLGASVPGGLVNNGTNATYTIPTPTIAGTYTVQITDSSTPPQTVTATTVVSVAANPAAPTISPSSPILCPAGTIVLNASAGYTTYNWGNGNTNQSLTVTTAGTYTVTVANVVGGCTASASVTVAPGTPPTPAITPTSGTVCAASPLALTATGGGTYSWSSGQNLTAAINNVTAGGTYTVTVTNAQNCTATTSVTLASGTPPTVSGITATCNLAATNFVIVATLGGTPPFTVAGVNGTYNNGTGVWTSDPIPNSTPLPTITVSNACGSAALPFTNPCGTTQICTNSGCFGSNLVTNGNFETATPLGFTSDYTLDNCSGLSTLCGGGLCEYRYAIYNSTTACVPSWNPNVNDHTFGTPGTGKFLMVNYPSGVVANTNIWCQSINVSTNTNYCFGGYFLNLLPVTSTYADPQYGFTVGGVNLGSTTTAPNDETWHFNGMQFNSGANTSLTVCIQSRNNGQLGNDLAIDDISLKPITNGTPPTAGNDAAVLCPGATSVVIPLLTNDLANSGTLNNNSLTVSAPNADGSITNINYGAGAITFTPSSTFTSGSTQFKYQICNSGGCCTEGTVTVSYGAAPSVTIAPTSAAVCAGVSTSMTATATPSASATYVWTTGGNTATISVTPAATTIYTVSVTAANGCTNTASQTITLNPAAATPTITGPNTVCGNTITLTASAATTYAWAATSGGLISSATNGQAIQTATAGTYNVTTTNAQGCTATASKIVTVGSAAAPTITQTMQCATNSILLNAGTGYTAYLWDNTTASQTLNVTASGTHTVQVTGTGGCTATASITVTVPSALMAMASATNVACFGNATGTVTASGMGGVAAYQYSIDNGTFSSTTLFSNLTAGTHTVTIRDANTCTASTTVNITQPAQPLTVSVTAQTTVPCSAGAVASATVAGAGGTTAYTYSIDGLPFQSNPTFTALNVGTHTVTVKDNNLCTATVTVTIVNSTATITPSFAISQNVNCSATVLGAGSASAIGGTAPYTYSVDGSAFVANNNFTALAAGTHTLAVHDANGCAASITFNITQAVSTMTSTIASQTNIIGCNAGNIGSVTVTVSGGTAPLQYSIDGLAVQSNSTFNNLAAGGHSVLATDANGCTVQQAVSITQSGSTVVATISAQTNANCNTLGNVTISGSSGVAPYQYSIDGGPIQSNGLFNNLSIGAHSATVRDNAGCVGNIAVNITQQPITLTVSASPSPIRCTTLGSAVVNGANGAPSYNYSVDGSAYQANNTFNNLLAGSHTVQVLDANGCSASSTFTVANAANTLAVITNSTTSVSCFGANTGGLSVTGSGGSAPYTYSNGGAFQTNGTFSGLVANTYIVTVKDNNGCTATQSVSVAQPAGVLQLDFSSLNNVTCFAGTNGSITLNTLGGTPPFQYQFGNNPAFTSNTIYNNLAAGAYAITVRDANGCQDFIILNVAQPSPVESSLAGLTNASCNGGTNGSVTVLATGGTAPFQYFLDAAATGQGSPTFTGLSVGNHTIRIVDNNNCQATQPFTIGQPSPISTAVTAQINVSCHGGSDATVSLIGTGGTPPYSYNGSSNNKIVNLAAGSFTVTVTDINGCSHTQAVNVTEPTAVAATATTGNILCSGSSTGSITINGSGGTPPYSYSIGAAFQNSNIFNGQTSANYTVSVKDVNDCIATSTTSITQPSSAVAASIITTTPISCKGGNNGSVTIGASGGAAPYTYSISGSFFMGSTFNNLSAGSYNATVLDNNGCQTSIPFIINEPATALTLSQSSLTNINCFGASNGSFNVTGAGGTAPYTYSVNNGAFAAQNSFTNLAAGTYQVMVQDIKGCLNNLLVNLLQPTAIDATITTISNIQCNNATTLGSVTVTAIGGTGALSYTLDNNTSSQITGTFNNLAAGSHTVTVNDASGCSRVVSFQITQPTALSINAISQANITCKGSNNGSITVLGNGGSPNYSYRLDSGTPQSGNTFTSILPGTHSIVMTDANTCSTSLSFTISEPTTGLTAAAATPINVHCNGGADGSLLINAAGGTAPYLYSSNGSAFQPNNQFSNLHAGTYSVTVRDANGCSFSLSSTVNEPAPVDQGVVTVNSVKCFNNLDGGFTINANGGVAPHRYSVQGSTFSTTNAFTGLAAGTYDVIIKDFNLCTALAIVNITQPSALTAVLSSVSNISCIGSFGSINVTATGGTPAYQFSVDNGTFQTQSNFATLSAGTHTVTVRDANACTSTISTNIIVANQLVVNAYADKAEICSNECVNLLATGNNGTGNYTYTWSGIGNGAVQRVCPTATTTYNCIITDASGCSNTTSVTVNVNAAPNPTIIGALAICDGSNANLTATGGAFTNYQWSTGELASSIYPTNTGIYTVIVTDIKGCKGSSSAAIAVRPLPVANAGNDISIYPGEPFQLNASGAGANGTYLWTSGNNLSSTTIPNPTGANLTETRSYTVIVTDEHGCTAADVVRVILEDQLACLKTDEGITPNGDGINETWVIDCLKYFPDNQVEIYNRWGQQVFVEKNYRNLYDGKLENGSILPDGTYYYIVKVFNTDAPKTLYKGTLTILR